MNHSAIEINNLSFSYNGEDVLKNINLKIDCGEHVAIIGHTGIGKTTLLYQISALLMPNAGTVKILGYDSAEEKEEIRKKVGLVFQEPDHQLFCMTVEEDVAFGPRNMCLSETEVKKRVDYALKVTGLEKQKSKPPHQLSGGQKKLACIAGILAMDPQILILDEPTTGLDPEQTREVMDFIYKKLTKEKKTMILVTHDVELIPKYTRRVILLHHGKIVKDGNPREIFNEPALLKKCGLAVPKTVELFNKLGRKDIALTVDEAVEKLR